MALRGERVVAHYGAWPARFWIGGRERVCGQISDLFAVADEGAGVSRATAATRAARAFFEHYARGSADDPDGDALYFGWPVERALRHGERHLEYEVLRPLQWLARPLRERPGDAGGADVLERFDEHARFLWERCADELRHSAIRDAARLTWRYLAHPTRRYLPLGVRDSGGTLRGLAVLCRDPSPEPGVSVVAEWLVPADERDVALRLLAALERHAAADGAHALATSVPPWSPWFALLQEQGFRVHPSSWVTVVRSFDRALDLETLRRTLWTVPGDGDLV